MSGKAKGNAYERLICRKLSDWWSSGTNDSIFWRTDSGARATRRGKQGKKTSGQCGDIVATDPAGSDLLNVIVFELKKGYSKFTLQDLIDKPKKAALQKWEEWIHQAEDACVNAESFSWALIIKRDKREELIVVPEYLWERVCGEICDETIKFVPCPFVRLSYPEHLEVPPLSGTNPDWIVCMKLEDWFKLVTPNMIREINQSLSRSSTNGSGSTHSAAS